MSSVGRSGIGVRKRIARCDSVIHVHRSRMSSPPAIIRSSLFPKSSWKVWCSAVGEKVIIIKIRSL